jgi:hypothetical protein
MKLLHLLAAAAFPSLSFAQAWLPGYGDPGIPRGVMTTWDADGPGPLPPQLTLGAFSTVNDGTGPSSNIVRFDGRAWRTIPVSTMPQPSALAQWNGDLYLGTSGFARLSGTAWVAPGPQPNGVVNALQPYGPGLVAGGSFNTIQGSPAIGLATWTGSSWLTTPDGIHDIYALTDFNGELIAAGNFSSLSATLIHWNGAAWSAWPVQPPGSTSYACAVYNNQLVVAGNQQSSPPGVVFTFDGVSWQPVGSNLTGNAQNLWVHDGQLYVSGTINIDQVQFVGVAKFDGTRWRLVGDGLNGAVYAMAPYAGGVALGGSFIVAGGGGAPAVCLYNGTTFTPLGQGLTPNGIVNALLSDGTALYAGGSFSASGPAAPLRVARFDGNNWQPMGAGLNGLVYALAQYNGSVYAGGSFSLSGGSTVVSRIARWDGAAWNPVDSGITGSIVRALCVYNGSLIAGGTFTSASGVSTKDLALWDGAAWHTMGNFLDGDVVALAVQGNDLIIGGTFTSINGVLATNVARWDGTNYFAMGSGLNNTVQALMVHNGSLVAAGLFTQTGVTPASRLARWDGTNWQPYTTGVNAAAASLGELGGDLLVGGSFTLTNGAAPGISAYFARWHDATCGSPDFNCDGDVGTDADIESFFACIAGTCPAAPCTSTADFNNDGDVGTDADIETFFRVLAGGPC